MKKYYHNVRVIHKPDECRYDIELKKHWYSRWVYVNCVKYYNTYPTGDNIFKQTEAMKVAKAHPTATLIHINSDPLLYAPSGEAWWEVPIPEISTLESTNKAYENYQQARKVQKKYLGKGSIERN